MRGERRERYRADDERIRREYGIEVRGDGVAADAGDAADVAFGFACAVLFAIAALIIWFVVDGCAWLLN